jgi:hypothetical protein
MLMLYYSAPKQNYKRLWVSTVTDEKGKVITTAEYTTKKGLMNFLKTNFFKIKLLEDEK